MRTLKNLINLCFLLLGHLFIRNKRKIVFGAWEGCSYSDNPKFLFEYFFDHQEWTIVWVGNKSTKTTIPKLPANASFAVRHSLLGIWHALTAKTWVFSHSPNDISIVALWGNALLIDTCHGVALKKVGESCPSFKKKHSMLDNFWRHIFSNKIYLAMPSKLQGENTIKSFPGLFQEPFLPFGSTTLDFIIHEKANIRLIKALRKKFAMLFNLPLDKKWIVYAPTFRHTTSVNFSFRSLPIDKSNRLSEILTKNNAIIIEKLHPDSITDAPAIQCDNIFAISGPAAKLLEPHELWLSADAIISDYSSAVIPFYLQSKPVIHFAYDYDFYVNQDTGLIADLSDIRFGLIAPNFDELCGLLSNIDTARNNCGKMAPQLIEYEIGDACNQYLNFISHMLISD